MKGTLRNYDPVKNYYIFPPIEHPDRPHIVPIETLEPCKNYHSYHIHGSVPVKPVKKCVEYLGICFPTDDENEVRRAVRAIISNIDPQLAINALACLLGQNQDFIKEFKEFETIKTILNKPKLSNLIFGKNL